ncbi:MAG: hypothetical protein HKN24_11005 [Acidimicrobiales bacterium]|nr:hypothetical protein [Acidimicrobiales bacterium]
MATTQTQAKDVPVLPTSTGLRWLVLAAIAVAVALAAFFVLTNDGSTPTVTFDGESVVYDGPSNFEAGEHTFIFDGNGSAGDIGFNIGILKDPDMTLADIEAADDAGPQPDFLGRSKMFWILADNLEDRVREDTVLLDPDTRYAVSVIDAAAEEGTFVAVFDVD